MAVPEKMQAFYPLVLLVLMLFKEGYGLQCYQCDSSVDPDCKENFDWEHLDQLTIRPTQCTVDAAKYCIKTTGVWGGVVGTTRFCSSRDMFHQCQYVTYADHNRIYRACIYTCSSDNCNSGIVAAASIITTAVLVTFSLLISCS